MIFKHLNYNKIYISNCSWKKILKVNVINIKHKKIYPKIKYYYPKFKYKVTLSNLKISKNKWILKWKKLWKNK
jgi:hypothetical protein